MMSVEQSVECLARETEVLEKTCLSAALSTTEPTLPEPDLNPGCCGRKSASSRVSFALSLVEFGADVRRWTPIHRPVLIKTP
jgi:hypothetical protein